MNFQVDSVLAISFTTSALFAIFALYFLARSHIHKKVLKAKQDDLSKKSVSEWIYELNAGKNLLEEKIQSGKSAFVNIDCAHGTAKTTVNQIEVGLTPPNFKHSDDEELKEAVRACRVEQHEIIKDDKATTSLSRWSWFGSNRQTTGHP